MRNVLLTGASRGLGLATADRLSREDYRLICVARHLSEPLASLSEQHPERVFFRGLDVGELDAIPAFVAGLSREFGPLYGIVNNAAIGLDGVLATQHATDIERMLRVNLHAPILLTKHACRGMLVRGEGRIINVSSIIASTGFNGLSVYAATKAGLEGFSRSLSRELGRAGITVNCIAPGYMETDMTSGLAGEKLNSVRRRAPLGLPATRDVAEGVAYLLSGAAVKISGTVLTIDGGSTA